MVIYPRFIVKASVPMAHSQPPSLVQLGIQYIGDSGGNLAVGEGKTTDPNFGNSNPCIFRVIPGSLY